MKSSINLKRNDMPRISTYASDTVDKNDKLIGTSSAGATKNFEVKDISKFLRENNAAGVAGQPTYTYVSNSSDQGSGTVYVNGTTPLAFSSVTTLRVSKYRKGDDNSIENLLEIFQGNDIIINDVEDLDNFGIYVCSNVAQDASTDFWTITLSSVTTSQGSFVNNKTYAIAVYSVAGDKSTSLTFSPTNFAGHPNLSEETVNGSTMNYIDWQHNLNKYPSITVTEAFSTTGAGFVPYKYVNANKVRVYFTGGTNGKIYAN